MVKPAGATPSPAPASKAPAARLPALPKSTARVGLFGGTFDPVHLGHLAVARTALRELELDRLFFIPAACAPLRDAPPVAPAADRVELLRVALAEENDPRLGVLDLEARTGTVQYTVDTLARLRATWPRARLIWLLGGDQFAQLDRWREPEHLARVAEFAVLDRPEQPPAVPPVSLARSLRWHRLTGPAHPASAAEIRRRRVAGENWELWLPPAVARAIEERKLYLTPADPAPSL
jgi:nicotinate-nucleotide adenylyltransferase